MSRTMILVVLILIALLTYSIQVNSLFNMDVSMLMHVSDRLLAGGKYGADIFESNPPMILYIYAIPVFAAKLFSLSYIVACRIFIFSLIVISLLLCSYLIRKLPDIYKFYMLLPVTAWILFMPGVSFGQREHIMMILIMPYVFLSIADLYGISLQRMFKITVAIMAGIGFCIKPHFFLPFFLYLLYARKITLPNKIIIAIPVIYLLVIAAFYSSYFTKILPYVTQYYYPYFDKRLVWANLGLQFSFVTIIIAAISFYFIKNHKLENVLLIYAVGFLAVYFMQKSNWDYHIYPAIAFVTLLAVQIVYRLLILPKRHVLLTIVFVVLGIFMVREALRYYYLINAAAINNKYQTEYKIIEHVAKLKNIHSVYFLAINPSPYPLVDYLPLKDVQLIQCYWFFPGMRLIKDKDSQFHLNNFRKLIVDDMKQKNPDVIVVSSRLFPKSDKDFSLNFFLANNQFKRILLNYKKVDAYDEVVIYKK